MLKRADDLVLKVAYMNFADNEYASPEEYDDPAPDDVTTGMEYDGTLLGEEEEGTRVSVDPGSGSQRAWTSLATVVTATAIVVAM